MTEITGNRVPGGVVTIRVTDHISDEEWEAQGFPRWWVRRRGRMVRIPVSLGNWDLEFDYKIPENLQGFEILSIGIGELTAKNVRTICMIL